MNNTFSTLCTTGQQQMSASCETRRAEGGCASSIARHQAARLISVFREFSQTFLSVPLVGVRGQRGSRRLVQILSPRFLMPDIRSSQQPSRCRLVCVRRCTIEAARIFRLDQRMKARALASGGVCRIVNAAMSGDHLRFSEMIGPGLILSSGHGKLTSPHEN
jgi:hypothetical protein